MTNTSAGNVGLGRIKGRASDGGQTRSTRVSSVSSHPAAVTASHVHKMSLGSAVFPGKLIHTEGFKMLSGRVVFMFGFFCLFFFYNWQDDAFAPVITTLITVRGETDIWMDGWSVGSAGAFLFRLGWIYQWKDKKYNCEQARQQLSAVVEGNKGEPSPVMKTILMLINSQPPPLLWSAYPTLSCHFHALNLFSSLLWSPDVSVQNHCHPPLRSHLNTSRFSANPSLSPSVGAKLSSSMFGSLNQAWFVCSLFELK